MGSVFLDTPLQSAICCCLVVGLHVIRLVDASVMRDVDLITDSRCESNAR